MTLTLSRNVEFGPPVVMTANFHNLSFLGDLYSRDTYIQGTENLVPEKFNILFCICYLYSGARDTVSASPNLVLTSFQGTQKVTDHKKGACSRLRDSWESANTKIKREKIKAY